MVSSRDGVTNSIAPLRLVLPGNAFPFIFKTDAESSFSCIAGAFVSWPSKDEPFGDDDEVVIQSVGHKSNKEQHVTYFLRLMQAS